MCPLVSNNFESERLSLNTLLCIAVVFEEEKMTNLCQDGSP